MANTKFTGLPTASAIVATDIFAVSQNVSTTPVSNKVAFSSLIDNTAYTSAWSGDIKGASKGAIYTQLHKIDTADDGTIINAATGFRIGGAAASGKLLVGNGTNFVASTPTYPNAASPTALKHIRSDGTNWIASTATISDSPSTAGKVLMSDGTNWVTSTPLFPTTVPATNTLLMSNGTTGFTATAVTYPVAANPAAGKMIRADGTNWVATTSTFPDQSGLGKILISDGTNWVASGPTFPNVSPNVGRFLQGDGTNYLQSSMGLPTGVSAAALKILVSNGSDWVASTPKFPNASATARKFIVSDGTDWVASTETQDAPGAAGNILVSDGTNWKSKPDILANAPITQQTFSATEAYMTGSGITLPAGTLTAGSWYRCRFYITKTAAGTVGMVINFRIGTLGTTSDALIITGTFAAGTAVADTGLIDFYWILRTTGASATSAAQMFIAHNATTTGLWNTGSINSTIGTVVAGTTFSSTTPTKMGITITGGTSFAGTVDVAMAELNIA